MNHQHANARDLRDADRELEVFHNSTPVQSLSTNQMSKVVSEGSSSGWFVCWHGFSQRLAGVAGTSQLTKVVLSRQCRQDWESHSRPSLG